MSRKPLSSRNAEHPPRRGPKKKGRGFTVNIALLVSELNHILEEVTVHGPILVTEADLKSPTPDRIQVIYLKILNFCFDVTVDSLKQSGFQSNPVLHPELCEEFTFRIQFFRVMKRFLKTCLFYDFRMEDIVCPDPHRTCRILSAMSEFIKFHFRVFLEDGELESMTQSRDELLEDSKELLKLNAELKQELKDLERKRHDEHDEEEELKKKIVSQGQAMQEKRNTEEYLQNQLMAVGEEKKTSEERMAGLSEELEKALMRLDTLSRKVVTSPDKLKANLARLRRDCTEVMAFSRETEATQRMWESLASQAKQLPNGVLLSLEQNFDMLTTKVEKKNALAMEYDTTEEQTGSLNRQLREMKQKHLKLLQFLKLQEEEKDRLACQNATISHSRASEDCQREILQLKKEIEDKLLVDKQYAEMTATTEKQQAESRIEVEKAIQEMDGVIQQLMQAYKSKSTELDGMLTVLGVPKD